MNGERERTAFAEFLKNARERRRLTLEQVADETKIATHHLEALEGGNIHSMPPGMYRRAMLRAYAESVGLDPQAALEAFEQTFEGKPPSTEATAGRGSAAVATIDPPQAQKAVKSAPPRPPSARAGGVGRRALAAVGALAAAVALLLWFGREPEPESPAVQQAPATPVQRLPERLGGVPSRAAAAPRTTAPPPQPDRTTSTQSPSESAPIAVSYSPASERPTDSAADAGVGPLVVQSTPDGARVTVNGIGWGVTPLTIRNLPAGAKRLRLSKDGFVSQERTIVLEPTGQPTRTRVTLPARTQ